jgi:hypothetical protein
VVAVADALGVDEPDCAELDGRAFLLGPEGESIGSLSRRASAPTMSSRPTSDPPITDRAGPSSL